MKDFNLRLYLKDNLPKKKDRDYLAWLADTDPYNVGHHILGKDWDYMIAKIPDKKHKDWHNKTKDAPSFEELLLNAINNRERYLEQVRDNGTE